MSDPADVTELQGLLVAAEAEKLAAQQTLAASQAAAATELAQARQLLAEAKAKQLQAENERLQAQADKFAAERVAAQANADPTRVLMQQMLHMQQFGNSPAPTRDEFREVHSLDLNMEQPGSLAQFQLLERDVMNFISDLTDRNIERLDAVFAQKTSIAPAQPDEQAAHDGLVANTRNVGNLWLASAAAGSHGRP